MQQRTGIMSSLVLFLISLDPLSNTASGCNISWGAHNLGNSWGKLKHVEIASKVSKALRDKFALWLPSVIREPRYCPHLPIDLGPTLFANLLQLADIMPFGHSISDHDPLWASQRITEARPREAAPQKRGSASPGSFFTPSPHG